MSGPFKVGEVVVHIGDPALTLTPSLFEYSGQECEIIGGLALRESWESVEPYPTYLCRFSDGADLLCAPHELRRKQPPTGLSSILRMFDLTAPAPREVEAA